VKIIFREIWNWKIINKNNLFLTMRISLEEVNSPDNIRLVSELSNTIWHQHYPSIITEEQIDYMLKKFHSEEVLTGQISRGQSYFLIKEGDKPVGYCSFSEKEVGHFFLHKFYLLENRHRRGIGRESFRLLLEEMKGAQEITLQVNRRNIKAINFYFRLGFSIQTAEDFDIGGGFSMDDFIMVKKIE